MKPTFAPLAVAATVLTLLLLSVAADGQLSISGGIPVNAATNTPDGCCAGDLDLDGDQDVLSGYWSGMIAWQAQLANGTFGASADHLHGQYQRYQRALC